jgi:hypothetical protein
MLSARPTYLACPWRSDSRSDLALPPELNFLLRLYSCAVDHHCALAAPQQQTQPRRHPAEHLGHLGASTAHQHICGFTEQSGTQTGQ